MVAGKDFVDMCAICKQGVSREDMEYQKGKVFHAKCFTEHGNAVPVVDPELAHLSARTRIELVQLKNLKMREKLLPSTAKKPKPTKGKKRTAEKKSKPKKMQAKKKAKKPKPKKVKKVKSKKHKTPKRR